MPERQEIVNWARSFIGVPFVHRGRSLSGVDCVGLLYVAYKPILDIPEPKDYDRVITSVRSFMEIREYADRIPQDEAGPGDIVLMSSGGHSTHYGLIAGNTVIHADKSVGRVVEHGIWWLTGGSPLRRAVAFFRMKGLAAWAR